MDLLIEFFSLGFGFHDSLASPLWLLVVCYGALFSGVSIFALEALERRKTRNWIKARKAELKAAR